MQPSFCDAMRPPPGPELQYRAGAPCVRMNIYDLAGISPSGELYLLFSAGLSTVEVYLVEKDYFKPNIYIKHNKKLKKIFFSVHTCNFTLSATTVDNEAKWDRKLIGEN